MNEPFPGYTLPVGSQCPVCGQPIEIAKPVGPLPPEGFKRNSIIVCDHCCTALKAGDTNLTPMTREDLMGLDPITRKALAVTMKAMMER